MPAREPDGGDVAATAADYACDLALADVPAEVGDRTRLVLLDTVGVCLRGSQTAAVSEAAAGTAGLSAGRPAGGRGGTVVATGNRRPPAAAALLNAAGGTTLELDEGNQRSGHPGIHTVPPAVAVAEHEGATGRELLTAVVAGYEVGARVGDLVRPLADGLHPHGAWAPVAGAVATGTLLGFDAERLAEAIRIAANPFVATHWAAALEGATVRDFYPGVSGAHGVLAAGLARGGVTGVERAITRCLLPYVAADPVPDDLVASTFASLGERHYVLDGYFKVHAACRYTHAPVEALAAIERTHGVDPATVDRITVRTFERGARLDDPEPANVLAAKFSTPYVLAARAVLGRSDAAAFAPDLVSDPAIRDLAGRVNLEVGDEFERRARDGRWGAAVAVQFDDGTRVEETVRDARGGGDDPFAPAEIHRKFDALAGAVLDDDEVRDLRASLLAVEAVEDVGSLLAPVRE